MDSSDLQAILQDAIDPPVRFTEKDSITSTSSAINISIEDVYCVRVEGSGAIYDLLANVSTSAVKFSLQSHVTQKLVLDLLYLILRRSTFDVIRFRSIEKDRHRLSLVSILLQRLDESDNMSVSKRILRLIGVVGLVLITATELKLFLARLKSPSELSLSLLQTFKMLLRQDDSSTKTTHSSFFSFGGAHSGLISHTSSVFIKQELQMSMWFRVESFNTEGKCVHLLWCSNEENCCVDIAIHDRKLCLFEENQGQLVRVSVHEPVLKVGCWYYLHVSFMRHRWSLWNRNQMTINLDGKVVYQEFIKLPKCSKSEKPNEDSPKLAIGHHFDGQIGNVYFFSESMLASTMELLSRSSTGKFKEGNKMNTSYDLLSLLPTDRATAVLSPKMLTVYHPSRVAKGHALDVHGGRHALMGALTYAWNIRPPRDVMVALGGVACLLPLFPRLLIENEQGDAGLVIDDVEASAGLGSTLAEIFDDEGVAAFSACDDFVEEKKNFENEGCIGLLLSVIARFLQSHAQYQQDMYRIQGLGMIEYALVNTPDAILYRESSSCVLALLNLQASVSENSDMSSFFIKRLLCNYCIWCKASITLQQSIMSIIVAATRGQPELYLACIGVGWLFEQLPYFFQAPDSNTNGSATSENTIQCFSPTRALSLDSAVDRPIRRGTSSASLSTFTQPPRPISYSLSSSNLANELESHQTPPNTADQFVPPMSSYKSFNRALVRQITGSSFDQSDSESVTVSEKNRERRRSLSVLFSSSRSQERLDLIAHRTKMRNSLYLAIHILVEQGLSVKEVIPFFLFMSSNPGSEVLSEVTQLLLRLVADNVASMPSAILEAFRSSDGVAAFILNTLIDNENENVRTAGIRILTLFFCRLDSTQSSPSMRRLSKEHLLYSAMRPQAMVPGLSVLHKRGGVQVMQHLLVNIYLKSSTMLSYSALLEMLVCRPGIVTQTQTDEKDSSVTGEFLVPPFKLTPNSVEGELGIYMEATILPLFINFAIEGNFLDQVFLDLMVMIKSTKANCEVFTSYVAWNTRLFAMISSVEVIRDPEVHYMRTDDVYNILNVFFTKEVTNPLIGKLRRNSRDSKPKEETPFNQKFEFGIEIYALLLVHCLEKKGGCKEVERMIKLSLDYPHGRVIAQAILSRLVGKLTFIMRSKYREIQKLAKSSSKSEKADAVDRIENLILLLITISSYLLDDYDAEVFPIPSMLTPPQWMMVNNCSTNIATESVDGKFSENIASSIKSDVELEVFHKDYNVIHGRMIILLQMQRLFDVFFWPMEGSSPIRNIEMLKFHKYGKRTASSKTAQYMTLITAMLRSSAYILEDFFPFGDVAELNFRRVIALIIAAHNVYPLKGPLGVDDWVLVLFAQTCKNLARIRDSLIPLFTYLNMEELQTVVQMNEKSEYLFEPKCHKTQLEIDEEAFERITKDKSICFHLEGIFNTEFGGKVLRSVLALVEIISTMYDFSFNLLADALDSGVLNALEILVQFIKSHFCRPSNDDDEDVAENELDGSGDRRRSSLFSLDHAVSSELSHRDGTGSELSDDESFGSIQWSASSERASSYTQRISEESSVQDILAMFKVLRNPFFFFDVFAEKSVLDSIETVRSLEKDGSALFQEYLKQSTFLNDTTTVLSTKFTDLSPTVYPQWRESESATASYELSLAQSVALSWQKNLREFEAEWSPWYSRMEPSLQIKKMSLHRDCHYRRMLFVNSFSTVNYAEFSYQQPSKKSEDSDDITFSRISLPQQAILRNSALMNKLTSWGEDDIGVTEEPASLDLEKTPSLFFSDKQSDEKLIYAAEATMIELEHSIAGSVYLTNKRLYFRPRRINEGSASYSRARALKTRWWILESLVETYGRRYLLKNCGIGMFFTESHEVFLAFSSLKELQKFFYVLRRLNIPSLISPMSLNPKVIAEKMNWTDLWRRRVITNFEYLMKLNTIAGRSFSDLTQYPVFPWIIADYTSQQLDLSNPATFRDLSKPVGALSEKRLEEIMERFNNSFDDVDIPKFMYGSHYSSAGVVLHYLIRQEPFTRMAISMQGGKFDCPDRLFFDFRSTWEGINNSISDVKELIPEFFYNPEFLMNTNKLPLGELQDKTVVNDVVLPPWATDVYDFIRQHREALESDYVSDNLHHWIDLIFGYKQTGAAAVEANNLFYYLTYENSVDIDEITDNVTREATISQVTNFGQTPSQLFEKKHLKRLPKKECMTTLCGNLENCNSIQLFTPAKQLNVKNAFGAVIKICCTADRLVTYHADMTVCFYKWSSLPDFNNPFHIKADKFRKTQSAALSVNSVSEDSLELFALSPLPIDETEEKLERVDSVGSGGSISAFNSTPMHVQEYLAELESLRGFSTKQTRSKSTRYEHSYFGHKSVDMCVFDGNNSRVVTCGYWDQGIRIHSIDSQREVAFSSAHVGPVTCVRFDRLGHTLVSAGADGTCRVWVIEKPNVLCSYYDDIQMNTCDQPTSDPNMICAHVLYGHKAAVTAIHYAPDQDLLLSGSEEGTLCLHTVKKGEYVRTILEGSEMKSIDSVYITPHVYLLAHSWTDKKLQSFWVNGELQQSVNFFTKIVCFAINGMADVLLCGQSDGNVVFLNVYTLVPLRSLSVTEHGSINCLSFADDLQFLLIGSEDGTFHLAVDTESRWRTMQAAIEKSPLLGL